MAMTLTGCATSGGMSPGSVSIAPAPDELRTCFNRYVPRPAAGPMTRQQIVALIAALKHSEGEKSACGRRLLTWYDTQAQMLGAK